MLVQFFPASLKGEYLQSRPASLHELESKWSSELVRATTVKATSNVSGPKQTDVLGHDPKQGER